MKTFTIAVLPGDGIGHEVVPEAVRVLMKVSELENFGLEFKDAPVGGTAFEQHGSHFPEVTKQVCKSSDAILFGSVGGPVSESHLPKWKDCERNSILALRKEFSFFANLRSLKVSPQLSALSPLKPALVEQGLDILVLRELIGDIYFGEHSRKGDKGARVARDVADYTEQQVAAIAKVAFEAARTRSKRVVSVDKANVLDTSKLWREVVTEVHADYKDVALEHMLVDNCAMQLVRKPSYFDVLLTSNLFGDILSDLVSVFGGSLGLMPSASLNASGFGLYEPAGGSAPDIAGKGIANPIAQLLSAALMLRFSCKLESAAQRIERAVQKTVESGILTADLVTKGQKATGTKEFTDAVIARLKS